MKQTKSSSFPLLEIQSVLTLSRFKNITISDLLKDISDEQGKLTPFIVVLISLFNMTLGGRIGYATNVKFCGMLIQSLAMHIEDLERIIEWLDPTNLGKISIKYFLKVLREIPVEETS